MKKIAFSTFLIILLLSLAYLRRPDLAFHQQWILARAALLTNSSATPGEEKPPLAFHDFYLITTTSDPATGKIVSFGFGHYIKVLNDDWGRRALRTLPPPATR
ncbi:MAG: hypothetical protein U1D97_00840 [Desulfuromonadales bacterium]|nr:hypothetical protein [Desulfuromonadales bacterium]